MARAPLVVLALLARRGLDICERSSPLAPITVRLALGQLQLLAVYAMQCATGTQTIRLALVGLPVLLERRKQMELIRAPALLVFGLLTVNVWRLPLALRASTRKAVHASLTTASTTKPVSMAYASQSLSVQPDKLESMGCVSRTGVKRAKT